MRLPIRRLLLLRQKRLRLRLECSKVAMKGGMVFDDWARRFGAILLRLDF